jgi:hypothetical protein
MSRSKGQNLGSSDESQELYVVELDERLEFGAGILDSDLQADDNTGCHNVQSCTGHNNAQCSNDSNC